jgi:hypothetical protein
MNNGLGPRSYAALSITSLHMHMITFTTLVEYAFVY